MAPVFYAPAAVSPALKSLPAAQAPAMPPRSGRDWKRRHSDASGGSSFADEKERGHPESDVLSYLERATRLELATGIPKMASGHFQEPCRTSHSNDAPAAQVEAARSLTKKKENIQNWMFSLIWSGQRGSNSLPPPWQGGALPDELCPRNRCYSNRAYALCQAISANFLKLFFRIPGAPHKLDESHGA